MIARIEVQVDLPDAKVVHLEGYFELKRGVPIRQALQEVAEVFEAQLTEDLGSED